MRSRPSVRTLEVSVAAAQHRSGGETTCQRKHDADEMRDDQTHTAARSALARSRKHDSPLPPPLPHIPSPPVTLQVERCDISLPSLLVCVVCVVGNCVDKKITGLHGACYLLQMRITQLLSDRRLMWHSRCSLICMTIHLHRRIGLL